VFVFVVCVYFILFVPLFFGYLRFISPPFFVVLLLAWCLFVVLCFSYVCCWYLLLYIFIYYLLWLLLFVLIDTHILVVGHKCLDAACRLRSRDSPRSTHAARRAWYCGFVAFERSLPVCFPPPPPTPPLVFICFV